MQVPKSATCQNLTVRLQDDGTLNIVAGKD